MHKYIIQVLQLKCTILNNIYNLQPGTGIWGHQNKINN